jgi:uncharacterized membrane protein YjgN (DUF898 family)
MEVINQKITPIIFKGKASEYFGIWIVNLLLSLITFGIYSAWAKVRRKKYFYNNTLIDNVGFDYHAKPKAILKGRIIAFAFFAAYGISANIHPFLPAVFLLILSIAVPWLVVRGSLFNARNTSHRGLRFDFVGTLREAIRVYIVLPLMSAFTLGLGVPYAAHERKQFSMNSHKFGLSQFDMQAKVKEFYKVYLKLFIFSFIIIICIAVVIAIPVYQSYANKAKAAAQTNKSLPNVENFVEIKTSPNLFLAANEETKEIQKVERVYSDANPPEALPAEAVELTQPAEQAEPTTQEMNVGEMSVEQAEPTVPETKTIVKEKTLEERIRERQKERNEKAWEMLKHPSSLLIMLPFFALYALFIFSFYGYMQARIGNLVWNNTTLDKLSFKSSLRARDFIWLYFTNIVAIMCTFGLATPWAQIRMAKYRTSKLQIVGDVDFDQFVGDKKAEVKATGEEIADMFDVDLSFG